MGKDSLGGKFRRFIFRVNRFINNIFFLRCLAILETQKIQLYICLIFEEKYLESYKKNHIVIWSIFTNLNFCFLSSYFPGADVSSTMCLFQAEQFPLVRFECAQLLGETQALGVQVSTTREGLLGPGLQGRKSSKKEEAGEQNLIRRTLDVPSEDLAGEQNGRLSKSI